MDRIYLSSARSEFSFDRKRGLVQSKRTENTQGYGMRGKGNGSGELISVQDHDADWAGKFAKEADCYFAAAKAYEELTTRAGKDAKGSEVLLNKAESVLRDVQHKLTLPALREQVVDKLKSHKELAKDTTEEAQRREKVLGKPAAAWELKDLDGKAHSLEGYRGKVVILDFWYRGCGFCIKAMPQVARVSEEFKNKPVVVLGMNTDRDDKDARFVVDNMKLTYPVLKAAGIPEKYMVEGFPTLIIIDKAGKVADMHVGYSPTLHDDVAAAVAALLKK